MAGVAAVEPATGEDERSPGPGWRPWTAPVALVGGVVLAAIAGLVVDLPAAAFGVRITGSHLPQGITIADTFVQDLAFVTAAWYCAHIGGRIVRSGQFGLHPPARGWRAAVGAMLVLIVAYAALSGAWQAILNPGKEKVLNQLGSGVASAALVCVVAPMCEEILFRGYIFTALRSWRGTLPAAITTGILFGAVHAGSAPVLDLVPLAALGFGLCLLYRRTGSLYPSMGVHSLNNSVAFASLAGLTVGEGVVLCVASLAGIALVIGACMRVGMISSAAPDARRGA